MWRSVDARKNRAAKQTRGAVPEAERTISIKCDAVRQQSQQVMKFDGVAKGAEAIDEISNGCR